MCCFRRQSAFCLCRVYSFDLISGRDAGLEFREKKPLISRLTWSLSWLLLAALQLLTAPVSGLSASLINPRGHFVDKPNLFDGTGLEEASVCTVHISSLITGIAEAAGLAATRWAAPSPGRFYICSSTTFNYWGRGELVLFSALKMMDTIFSAGQEKNKKQKLYRWVREQLVFRGWYQQKKKSAAGVGRWKE